MAEIRTVLICIQFMRFRLGFPISLPVCNCAMGPVAGWVGHLATIAQQGPPMATDERFCVSSDAFAQSGPMQAASPCRA